MRYIYKKDKVRIIMPKKKNDFISKYKWHLVIAIIALLLIGMIIGMYNRFVVLDQQVNIEWSEVNNQYQRQADLIPNLVSTVASAVTVERRFVNEVTERYIELYENITGEKFVRGDYSNVLKRIEDNVNNFLRNI